MLFKGKGRELTAAEGGQTRGGTTATGVHTGDDGHSRRRALPTATATQHHHQQQRRDALHAPDPPAATTPPSTGQGGGDRSPRYRRFDGPPPAAIINRRQSGGAGVGNVAEGCESLASWIPKSAAVTSSTRWSDHVSVHAHAHAPLAGRPRVQYTRERSAQLLPGR